MEHANGALEAARAELSRRNEMMGRLILEQRAIIDNISDGLLVIEKDGCVRHMNQPAGRILSLDPKNSIGKHFSDLLDFEPLLGPVFRTGTGYIDREQIINTKTRHLHLLDTVIPIINDQGEVEVVVNTFREIQRARRVAHEIAGSRARYGFKDIIGQSDTLQHSIETARRAARGAASILLMGESGTGKELFAQSIHAASNRRNGPFVAINCAALPRDLIESELFGYTSGSFTGALRAGRPGKFELASSGTIFLDEVTEMPLDVQAKLLRVLQEREITRIGDNKAIPVDVRIISASNRNLSDMVANRLFREDLYYRLNVIGINIPALRERDGDIETLAEHLMRRCAAALGKNIVRLSKSSLRQLRRHSWPGNVRELENVIEMFTNLADDEVEDLEISFPTGTVSVSAAPAVAPLRTLQDAEADFIRATIEQNASNVTQAAIQLGISKVTLYAKIKKYGISLSR